MRDLLHLTAETAARYLDTLDDRSVARTSEALAALAELHEPMTELPTEPACVLETLDRIGSPATMGMVGPRYSGFVISGSLPAFGLELARQCLGSVPGPVRDLADKNRTGRGCPALLLDALKLPVPGQDSSPAPPWQTSAFRSPSRLRPHQIV